MKKIFGAMALACLAVTEAGAFTYSARSYVQKGLIGHFDAIDNDGFGVHDAEAAEWKNLAGTNVIDHLPVTVLTSHSWGDNYLALKSGGTSSPNRLITPRQLTLTQFTIEDVVQSGADKNVRRWDIVPYNSAFESWLSGDDYFERINFTRLTVKYPAQANKDMHFITMYDSVYHKPQMFVDGVHYKTVYQKEWDNPDYNVSNGRVAGYVVSNKQLAFLGSMNNGRAYALRVYDRAITAEEMHLNEVIDQLRFFGKTPETVVLPEGRGWTFDADGVLKTSTGKVLLRPLESSQAREVTNVAFSSGDDATLLTATLGEGTEGVANAVYLAYGDKDYGAVMKDWPKWRRMARVESSTDSVTFAVPEECAMAGENVKVRLFTAVATRPYDQILEYVTAKGKQWIDTDYFANPKTVADFTVDIRNVSQKQQRIFGADGDNAWQAYFSFSCYINGSGNWAWSCNDNNGFWDNTGKPAVAEKVRIRISAPEGIFRIDSPSYKSFERARAATRTQTATCAQGIFIMTRKKSADAQPNFDHGNPVLDADFYFGSYAEDGEYVRTYEPCVTGGRGALYEGVGDSICFSQGGEDFIPSGKAVDCVAALGEVPTMSSAAAALPREFCRINTYKTAMQIDHALVYTAGGSKEGTAPLTLTNAANDFGGIFTVYEGLLCANFGAGLAATDHLVIDGGIWAPGTATADVIIGTGAGQVEVKGTRAGFAAKDGNTTISFNGGSDALVYPSTLFNPGTLVFNDKYCTGTVTLAQQLANGNEADVTVEVGGGKVVFAEGVATTKKFTKTGTGEAEFRKASNSFANFQHSTGNVKFVGTNEEECRVNVSGTLNVASGTSVAFDNAKVNANNVTLNGNVVINEGTEITSGVFKCKAGTVTQNGGSVNATNGETGSMAIEPAQNQTCEYYLKGGSLERTPTGGNFQLGRAGSNSVSRLYVENTGHLITHCQYPSIGRSRFNKGYLYVRNGGKYTADSTASNGAGLCAGDEGNGYIEVANGGEIDLDGFVSCVNSYTHAEREGEFRLLDGGLITCLGINRGAYPCKRAQVVLDGGTLRVRQSSKKLQNPFMQNMTMANIGVNGTTIDTNGRDILFRQNLTSYDTQSWTQPSTAAAIASCKAFTKAGAGTLTLEGSNSYAVATCVAGGTLKTATAFALPECGLVKLAGGTLDLNGTSQKVDMLAGNGTVTGGNLEVKGAVWPGLGTEGGTLTFTGGTLAPGKLCYSVSTADGKPVCGKLNCTGTLDLSGIVITAENLENLGNRSCVILEAASITGTPAVNLPHPYRITRQGNVLRLGSANGTTIIIR